MLNKTIFAGAAALVLASPVQAASSCRAQPDSPQCSAGKDCHGSGAIENGTYMAFSENGKSLELCAGESCAHGTVTARTKLGGLLLVRGSVRTLDHEGRPRGAPSAVTALIDRKAALAHVAGQGLHVLMDCSPAG